MIPFPQKGKVSSKGMGWGGGRDMGVQRGEILIVSGLKRWDFMSENNCKVGKAKSDVIKGTYKFKELRVFS